MPERQSIPKFNSTQLKDYFLTNEEFELRENKDFGFLETYPQPIEDLDRYYASENYISHTDSKKNAFEKIYQFVKNYNIRYKFGLLTNLNSNSHLLDYGCGAGDFLAYAKNKGVQVFGVEPNQAALKITRDKIGQDLATEKKLEDIHQQFDYITLWHVLEHIPDLFDFINQLRNHLTDDGKLIIAVPNYASFDAKFYKEYWAAYDVPRHLWHFSPKSIETLFNSFGMKIEKKHPLWFDSYYVSMLSEKYKNSPFGIFRAIGIATLSNFKGIFTGNYSSVVYQITKNENKSE